MFLPFVSQTQQWYMPEPVDIANFFLFDEFFELLLQTGQETEMFSPSFVRFPLPNIDSITSTFCWFVTIVFFIIET